MEDKICRYCKHFNSYGHIYEDNLEPYDIGECHKGDYPRPSDKCGIGWEDSCDNWEKWNKSIEENQEIIMDRKNRFLQIIKVLVTEWANHGNNSMVRADQIKSVCEGFCEYVKEIEEKAWMYDECCK